MLKQSRALMITRCFARHFARQFAQDFSRYVRLLGYIAVASLSACATSFDIQAHRGGRGLSPENTLPAFTKALSFGVTTLELDIGVSADDELVIAHDPKLNPNLSRDASGNFLSEIGPSLRSLNYEQIKRYDVGRLKPGTSYAAQYPAQEAVDGTSMPRLIDLFALVKAQGDRKVRFNIETKLRPDRPDETADPETFVRLLLRAIASYELEQRVTIQSFDWRTLKLAQTLAPHIPTVYLSIQQPSFNNITRTDGPSWTAGLNLSEAGSVPKMIKQAGGAVWSPFFRDLTAESLKEAQALGLKVVVWTVNDPKEMRRLKAMGLDGIITDRPDLLINVLKE
jgi:glycerophosphoryl diester phosphodiesterase